MTRPEHSLASQAGRLLESARDARGKSRRELATELGLADTSLLSLEHGRDNPTLERLERIAAGYGVRFELTTKPIPTEEREAAKAAARS